jgi:hypothetical protein
VEINELEPALAAWFQQVHAHNISADGTIIRGKAFILLLVWEYTMLWVPTIRSPDLTGERIFLCNSSRCKAEVLNQKR